ncbi:MAG TPA: STAS domain-containing protein [Mycobacteriales bacterium]|nr:STAS domain-containing protein [Mycobacteriales bacterium]
MRVDVAVRSHRAVIALDGDLDLASAPQLVEATKATIAHEPQLTLLVLDLADVSFMDSSGLKAVLHAAHAMRGRKRFLLINVQPQVARMIDLIGDGKLLTMHRLDDPLPEAVADLSSR